MLAWSTFLTLGTNATLSLYQYISRDYYTNPVSKTRDMGMFVEFKRKLPNTIHPAYGLALIEEKVPTASGKLPTLHETILGVQ